MFAPFITYSTFLFQRLDLFIYKYINNEPLGWRIDLKIASLAFLVTLTLAFPSLWLYSDSDSAGRLLYQILQAENPLNRDLPSSAQILSYRFFVPLINYLLGLRGLFVVVIPILASYFNLFLCSKLIRKSTNSTIFTLYTVVGISLTWFVAEGTSFWGTTDSVSHFLCLIPAAFNLSPIYLFLSAAFSLFVDERALFTLIFLWLFLLRRDIDSGSLVNYSFKNFPGISVSRRAIANAMAIVAGIIFWLVVRFVIDSGLLAPAPDITIVTSQIPNFPDFITSYWPAQILNYFCTYKWFYLFPFFTLLSLKQFRTNDSIAKLRINLSGYYNSLLILFLCYTLIVMVKGDVWRSMAFSYFFILESILILHALKPQFSKNLSRLLMVLMVITPVSFFGLELTPQISYPLPIALLRIYAGIEESLIPWFIDLLPAYVPS